MLVEDLFEQEAGFPQTWGPQEGLVDFVGGVPLVVAADDAAFLDEAAAAARFDLAGAAFMPHLVAKKTDCAAASALTVGPPVEPSALLEPTVDALVLALPEEDAAPSDPTARDAQRKQRNRESAARSRKRTRERMAYLENLVDHLMKKNRRLELAVQQLSSGVPSAPAPVPVSAVMGMPNAPVAGPAPELAVFAPLAAASVDDLFRLDC